MDEAETHVLAYMTFPAQHRTKLHSTNLLARLMGEIKRRTDSPASSPNEANHAPGGACSLSREWDVQRARYITLETNRAFGR